MKQRTPMKPIPGYIIMRGDVQVSAFLQSPPPKKFRVFFPEERVVPVEIRERPKPRRAEGKGRGK